MGAGGMLSSSKIELGVKSFGKLCPTSTSQSLSSSFLFPPQEDREAGGWGVG